MSPSRIAVFAVAIIAIACMARGGQRPRVSPHESTPTVTIDGSNMYVTYGRPYMRGRKIMGGLVPYGRIWCPGADEVTTLTTSKAMRLGGLSLRPGEYALWMLPTADEWTLIVNSDSGAFHTYHNPRTDLGRVPLAKRAVADPVEQLTFAIEKNPSGRGGILKMMWETTEVSAPFTVVE